MKLTDVHKKNSRPIQFFIYNFFRFEQCSTKVNLLSIVTLFRYFNSSISHEHKICFWPVYIKFIKMFKEIIKFIKIAQILKKLLIFSTNLFIRVIRSLSTSSKVVSPAKNLHIRSIMYARSLIIIKKTVDLIRYLGVLLD